MNRIFKNTLLLGAGLLFLSGTLFAAKTTEKNEKPIEIKVNGQKQEIIPVPEVKEVRGGIPEVPQPLKRGNVAGADKVRLDSLEQKRLAGKMTETEYQLEKDALGRDANLKR